MDTIALADLASILAAVLGPILAFAVVVMRYQHLDSVRTRDLIERSSNENRDLITEVRSENRDLIKENRDLIEEVRKENRDLIKENRDLIEEVRKENRDGLSEVNRGLSDARERLARIEGHFGIGAPRREDADEAAA